MPLMLTMDQVAPFVQQTLAQIRLGVYLSRVEDGIFCDLPDEIEITATIVTKPQSLPITATTQSLSKSREGGSTTTTQNDTDVTTIAGTTASTPNRTTKVVDNGTSDTNQSVSDGSNQVTTQGTSQSTSSEQQSTYRDDSGDSITG